MINGLNALTVSFTVATVPSQVLFPVETTSYNLNIDWKAHGAGPYSTGKSEAK